MNDALFDRGLAELGLGLDKVQRAKAAAYLDAIERWNPAYGLVGANGDELIVKHLLDSLAPLAVIENLAREVESSRAEVTVNGAPRAAFEARPVSLADLGTGAGLPGIPLAIAHPEWSVSLVDRMTRRIRFLEAMRDELPLPNAEIVEEQVEHAKGCYDMITFRAFRPFERKLFKRVFAMCSKGGYVIAYKGKREKAEAELSEIEGLYSSAVVYPIKVPFLDEERCLMVMRPAFKSPLPQ